MKLMKWTGNKYVSSFNNSNKRKIIVLNTKKGDEIMGTMTKPINAMVEVTESKYVAEICSSLLKKPSEKAQKRNNRALQLLRRARRG